jgi:hypothetical protein
MKGSPRWNEHTVTETAKLFDTMKEFRETYPAAYQYARRNGILAEIGFHMDVSDDPAQLLRDLLRDLKQAQRFHGVANKCRSMGSPSTKDYETEDEYISSTYMDHEIGHWMQAAEEAEERAMKIIAGLKRHGADDHVKLAWDMFLNYQTKGRQGTALSKSFGIQISALEAQ